MDPLCVVPARVQGLGLGLPLALALLLFCTDALAQSRRVFVNGQWLNDAQVAGLARMNCSDIPDGSYWLNTQTGAWGYAGNRQVQGLLGDGCSGSGSGNGNGNGSGNGNGNGSGNGNGNGNGNGGGGGGDAAVGRHGPYATLRRAEEVANEYRAQGYRAVAFHSGDGYVVDVRR